MGNVLKGNENKNTTFYKKKLKSVKNFSKFSLIKFVYISLFQYSKGSMVSNLELYITTFENTSNYIHVQLIFPESPEQAGITFYINIINPSRGSRKAIL